MIKFNSLLADAEYVYQDSIDKQRMNTVVPIGATTGMITVTANGRTTTSLEPFAVTVPIYFQNVMVSTASIYGGVASGAIFNTGRRVWQDSQNCN